MGRVRGKRPISMIQAMHTAHSEAQKAGRPRIT